MSYRNQYQSVGDPGPVVFVLFGATGDLARRLVLPAFFRLACEGLLPRQWLLVGNGRGDVGHESFRAHVHDALTEFGPEPEPAGWDAFAERVFFAGGGFSTDSPGSLPGVLGAAEVQCVRLVVVPGLAAIELEEEPPRLRYPDVRLPEARPATDTANWCDRVVL